MKKSNHFIATGFVCNEPDITHFENVDVARFAFAIQMPYIDANGTKNINSAIIRAEAWRKNNAEKFFARIKKGERLTLEGELQPNVFFNKKTQTIESKIVLNAIRIHPNVA